MCGASIMLLYLLKKQNTDNSSVVPSAACLGKRQRNGKSIVLLALCEWNT